MKNLVEVVANKLIYHKSNPLFRKEIEKLGLIPKGKSETWLSDTNISGKVIFATNSDKPEEWFDSTYDDDTYEISTKGLSNKWYNDPNFEVDSNHIITFEPIPIENIKLIYTGTGHSINT